MSRIRARALSTVLAVSMTASAGVLATAPSAAGGEPDVLISEVANGGPAGSNDSFIELTNAGDAPADLDTWRIYHCGASGSRGARPLVPPLSGVTLEPGETYVIAHNASTVADVADARFATALADDAMGVWLEDGAARLVDRIAVSPSVRDNVCGPAVSSTLDYHRAQSYQRVAATGDVTVDFIVAGRTPQAANTERPDPGVRSGDLLISELANGGSGGDADEFVELANTGTDTLDVGGWRLYACTALGARPTSGLLATVPPGTSLEPGGTLVVAHDSVSIPDGVAALRYPAPALSEDGFGALLEDAGGTVVDAVGVHETDNVHEPAIDSPCAQGTALPDRLDYASDHSYQRERDTGDNAADFVEAQRTIGDAAPGEPARPPVEARESGVRVSEFAHGAPGEQFVELANYGDEAVSLDGWVVEQCRADGRRALKPSVASLDGVTLTPGETFVADLEGAPLDPDGYGFAVHDAHDRLVDRVGAYFAKHSPCTDGVSLVPFLETDAGQTHQRLQDTGDNVRDFVRAPATPGELPDDLRAPADIPAEDLEPVDVPSAPRPAAPELAGPADGAGDVGAEAEPTVTARHTAGAAVDLSFHGGPRLSVVENAAYVYTGVSELAPPAARRSPGESRHSAAALMRGDGAEPVTAESTEGFPYQRFELVLDDDVPRTFDVVWSGRSTAANEVQLYVWSHRREAWTLLDAAAGRDGGEITLVGAVEAADVRGRTVEVLVQDGPATGSAFVDAAPDQAFEDPGDYDFALGMLPDPQQLAEIFRDVHADQVQWLAQNQDARKIAYTSHVGDIVQNWMWGTHTEPRARDEWQFASDVMGVLEDAGHPFGILPGNHDNKWGRSNDLYNEYFPPARFAGTPWYGDSWRPGDNASHYDTLEIQGANFLVVNIGYADYFGRDETLEWASRVISDHPDHNVIVVAHEYLNRDAVPTTPENDRWTSLGERIWQEVVRPHENVFLVLGGHVNGVAHAVKHDVGGEGRVVTEMLANYQGYRVDGLRKTGFLRLLQFDIDSKTLSVNTYSPSLDEHNAGEYYTGGAYGDERDEFVVPVDLNDSYEKRVETTAFAVADAEPIGAATAGDGEQAGVVWSGLRSRHRYVWYVDAVDAAGRSARSPLWSFARAR